MRDVLVHAKLDALRVDHDEAHFIRRGAEENARQHRVDRDRFARARRSRNQQVRHRREVGHVRLAVNRLAERQRQLRARALIHLRLQQLAKRNLLARLIRNLDADGRLSRDAIDQHRFGLHREAQIVGEARDLAVFHPRIRLELERRHDRSRVNLCDRAFDGELAALLLEQARAFHQLAFVDLALGFRRVEQRQRRNRECAVAPRLPRFRIGQRQRRILDRLRPLRHHRWASFVGGTLVFVDRRRTRGDRVGRLLRGREDRRGLAGLLRLLGQQRLTLAGAPALVEPVSQGAEHARAPRPAHLRSPTRTSGRARTASRGRSRGTAA